MYGNYPKLGMFCMLYQKHGNPPSTTRGAWTTVGLIDWNHTTEQLQDYNRAKWHRDSNRSSCNFSAQGKARREQNHSVKSIAVNLLPGQKLSASYNHIIFYQQVVLQIANGD